MYSCIYYDIILQENALAEATNEHAVRKIIDIYKTSGVMYAI